MAYCAENFIVPLRPADVNVKLRDTTLTVNYNLRPCTEVSNIVKGKTLIIKMKSDTKDILLDFEDEAEARTSLVLLKNALETACRNAKNRGIIGGNTSGGNSADFETKIFVIGFDGQTEFNFITADMVKTVISVYVNGVLYTDWSYADFTQTLTVNPSLYALETSDELKILFEKTS